MEGYEDAENEEQEREREEEDILEQLDWEDIPGPSTSQWVVISTSLYILAIPRGCESIFAFDVLVLAKNSGAVPKEHRSCQ